MDYPSNSFKQPPKEEIPNEQPAQPIISKPIVNATLKPQSGFKKVIKAFFDGDISMVKTRVWNDILSPTIKRTASDALSAAIETLIYGADARPRRTKSSGTRVSYESYYEDKYRERRRDDMPSLDNAGYIDDADVGSASKAEEVMDTMMEVLDQYKFVRVSDYFSLIGVSNTYSNNDYGWYNLTEMRKYYSRGTWYIHMPRSMPRR